MQQNPLPRWLGGSALVALGLFLLVSLITFDPHDPNGVLESYPVNAEVANSGGRVGAWAAHHLLLYYGLAGVLSVPILLTWGISHLRLRSLRQIRKHLLGAVGVMATAATFVAVSQAPLAWEIESSLGGVAPGGLLGLMTGGVLVDLIGRTGSLLVILAAFVGCAMLTTGTTVAEIRAWGEAAKQMLRSGREAQVAPAHAAPAYSHHDSAATTVVSVEQDDAPTRATSAVALDEADEYEDEDEDEEFDEDEETLEEDDDVYAEADEKFEDEEEYEEEEGEGLAAKEAADIARAIQNWGESAGAGAEEAEDTDDMPPSERSLQQERATSSAQRKVNRATNRAGTRDDADPSERSAAGESDSVRSGRIIHLDSARAKLPKEVQKRREKLANEAAALVKQDRREERMEEMSEFADAVYELPPMSLLEARDVRQEVSADVLQQRAERLLQCLRDFSVSATLVNIARGPSVTMFELRLAPGIRLSRVTNLSDNIAMSLSATGVRILAPIPGKSTIGVEMPNIERDILRLRPVLESETVKMRKLDIPFVLGRDSEGRPLVPDLRRMPHMLIAGTTGSGKSVCINSILCSILMTRSPADVKLILVDPKQVELMPYRGVPHLIHEVISDMQLTGAVLEWAVRTMESRYELLSAVGVREINTYNRLAPEARLERVKDPTFNRDLLQEHMPYIVIVIDEFADLMMVAQKEVEASITRLTQKARAVGIHVILATQRPSVDVITGLIKVNMPSRVAFKVASKVDSRTILDQNGADKLVGHGDMLYMPPTSSTLVRAKGTFVSDEEVEEVVSHVKKQCEPEYLEDLMNLGSLPDEKDDYGLAGHTDELFERAVEVVLTTQRGSVSLLQRKLAIGYTRAAKLIDMMADAGILGEYKGSKTRDVFMTIDEWDRRKDELVARANGARPPATEHNPVTSNKHPVQPDTDFVPGRSFLDDEQENVPESQRMTVRVCVSDDEQQDAPQEEPTPADQAPADEATAAADETDDAAAPEHGAAKVHAPEETEQDNPLHSTTALTIVPDDEEDVMDVEDDTDTDAAEEVVGELDEDEEEEDSEEDAYDDEGDVEAVAEADGEFDEADEFDDADEDEDDDYDDVNVTAEVELDSDEFDAELDTEEEDASDEDEADDDLNVTAEIEEDDEEEAEDPNYTAEIEDDVEDILGEDDYDPDAYFADDEESEEDWDQAVTVVEEEDAEAEVDDAPARRKRGRRQVA